MEWASGISFDPPNIPTFAGHFVGASSQYAEIASNAGFVVSAGQDLGIAGWVRFNGAGTHANERVCGKWGAAAASDEYLLFMAGAGNLLEFLIVNSGLSFANASPTTSVTTGVWHFFYAEYDHATAGGQISLTVDNDTAHTSVTTAIGNLNTSASTFDVATDATHGSFITGDIGPLGVWKRKLTGAEQTTLFNAGVNSLAFSQLAAGFSTNLTAYYDTANNFNDSSANGNNLTATNAPTFVSRP